MKTFTIDEEKFEFTALKCFRMKEFSSNVRVKSFTMVEEKFEFKNSVMPQSEGFSSIDIYFEGQRKNIMRISGLSEYHTP